MFILTLAELFSYRKILVNSFCSNTFELICLMVFKRVIVSPMKTKQNVKVFNFTAFTVTDRIEGILKILCKLFSQRWLNQNGDVWFNFIPFGLWLLNNLFLKGRVNFKSFDFKQNYQSLISQTSLFHTFILDEKKEVLKKLWLVLVCGLLWDFLVM